MNILCFKIILTLRRLLNYNPNKPLIYIHIPKTAGTSIKHIFKEWFGSGFSQFYRIGGKYIFKEETFKEKKVIFGHFNSNYGFAVDKLFPLAEQYITLLRDPLDTHISAFFYHKKRFSGNKLKQILENISWLISGKFSRETFKILNAHKSWIDSYKSLDDWLINEPLNYVNHFPSYTNKHNYKDVLNDKFIAIGLYENLERSLLYFSDLLNKNYKKGQIPIKNVGKYNVAIDDETMKKFRIKNELAYLIYDYVRQTFK